MQIARFLYILFHRLCSHPPEADSLKLSILDLAPIRQGSDAAAAFVALRAQAQTADRLGYERYWLAEHHNMAGIGSSATSVLIGHIAAATERIRVGSGGIMLPNHAPLVIAEQFGTLDALYPGRIDLGLGRAPGTDPRTAYALRRDRLGDSNDFPRDVAELQAFLRPAEPGQVVRAVPGAGANVPIWLLGSSLFSAQLAAMLGLPYAFASHFAPDYLLQALDQYRSGFKPSEQLQAPYAIVGINALAADSDDEARHLFTSTQVASVDMMRGLRQPMGPPIDDIERYWTPEEKRAVEHKLHYSYVGDADTVEEGLSALLAETGADEIMTTVRAFDPAAGRRSLEILAQVRDSMPVAAG